MNHRIRISGFPLALVFVLSPGAVLAGPPEHTCVIKAAVLGRQLVPETGLPRGQVALTLGIRLPKVNQCLLGGDDPRQEITLHLSQATAQKIQVGSHLRLSYDRIEVFGESSMHHEDAWKLERILK